MYSKPFKYVYHNNARLVHRMVERIFMSVINSQAVTALVFFLIDMHDNNSDQIIRIVYPDSSFIPLNPIPSNTADTYSALHLGHSPVSAYSICRGRR